MRAVIALLFLFSWLQDCGKPCECPEPVEFDYTPIEEFNMRDHPDFPYFVVPPCCHSGPGMGFICPCPEVTP